MLRSLGAWRELKVEANSTGIFAAELRVEPIFRYC